MRETALYHTIKSYLMQQGFDVKSEIKDADVVAFKQDTCLIVEMKTSLSIQLIDQGLKRQMVTPYVYLAVPTLSDAALQGSAFKAKQHIIRRCHLGLMLVDVTNNHITILEDPKPFDRTIIKKKKQALKEEFMLRQTALNQGGVSQTKIITAYRELALMTAFYLKDGEKTTQALKQHLTQKAVQIVQRNYYGWFKRLDRGLYQLSESGHQALKDYQHVIKILQSKQEALCESKP